MTVDPSALRRLVRDMPKAEVHVHLDGALRVDTALALAGSRGIPAPTTAASMAAALVAPDHPGTEVDLLTRFELPIRLMQDADALRRVTRELVEAKAADGVRYLEIKWAPWLHTERGLTLDGVIDAVCAAAADATRSTSTVVRLVVVAVRSHPLEANVALARAAAGYRDAGVAAFDFAGSEADDPDPRLQAVAFDVARREGLAITLHAGDLPDSAVNVRHALDIGPDRIAHGVSAIDDPELCGLLRVRGVPLDLCPTSNIQSGSVRSFADHPLARLHRLGVPVTLSTDDPTISAVSLTDEYVRAVEWIGLTIRELWMVDRLALDVAFAADDVLEPIRSVFDAWALDRPAFLEGRHDAAVPSRVPLPTVDRLD